MSTAKSATNTTTNTTKPAPPAGPPAGGSPPAGTEGNDPAKPPKGKYVAVWNVRANKQDFAEGEEVTGLSDKQRAELIELGAIEKK